MVDIPRLNRSIPLVDKEGNPSFPFHLWWDRVAQSLEDQLADLTTAQTDIINALSTMPDIPNVTILADHTGTVSGGELPRVVTAQHLTGSTDNTASATWSYTVDSGSLTASITAPGELTITAVAATSVVTLQSVYSGVTKSRSFTVYLTPAAPPIAAGGSATDTSFSTINSATHAAISNELTVPVASSGNVDLTATLIAGAPAAANGTYEVFGKWQWWNGVAWADVAAETASNPDIVRGSTPVKGALNVTAQKTGLTPANNEKFRFQARNSSGTTIVYFTGTASAISS